jgi:hypothetical protein
MNFQILLGPLIKFTFLWVFFLLSPLLLRHVFLNHLCNPFFIAVFSAFTQEIEKRPALCSKSAVSPGTVQKL